MHASEVKEHGLGSTKYVDRGSSGFKWFKWGSSGSSEGSGFTMCNHQKHRPRGGGVEGAPNYVT